MKLRLILGNIGTFLLVTFVGVSGSKGDITAESIGGSFITLSGDKNPLMPLDPVAAALVGISDPTGYVTTAIDGRGNPTDGSTAYGGPAPDSLSLRSPGVSNEPGHFYWGFANTYPLYNSFTDYEVNGALPAGTRVGIKFNHDPSDRINFIGVVGKLHDVFYRDSSVTLVIETVDPVYSPTGGADALSADALSALGVYINYDNESIENDAVDFGGSVFATNIHWWDIDVPAVPTDGIASIRLNTSNSTDAVVDAYLTERFMTDNGYAPEDIKGWIDGTPVPLNGGDGQGITSQGVEYFDNEEVPYQHYTINNNQWSAHDIGFGVPIPEPSSSWLLLIGVGVLVRRRRV
ncbi:MAG: PEP-CTERM sorting domain-containing protein [Verrucomicrobiae bacterium]|nr:PEP-CTERM sorting domain-containing protein [Verrucomicrobiae bacterium]NNJ86998.1 PEP-CTERM sorting domain-containing protein [Akkermansiaceae bacterium]